MSEGITNTTKKADERPGSLLLDAMVNGSENMIQNMESKGQRELANSHQLPVECYRTSRYSTQGILENAGVVFGEPLADDPLFCEAKLPEGWKIEATGHSMWSYLLDEKGRRRAGIFYKAAFYDRHAHIRAEGLLRMEFPADYEAAINSAVFRIEIFKGTEQVHVVEGVNHDDAYSASTAWLNEHYPEWENPWAYWNED